MRCTVLQDLSDEVSCTACQEAALPVLALSPKGNVKQCSQASSCPLYTILYSGITDITKSLIRLAILPSMGAACTTCTPGVYRVCIRSNSNITTTGSGFTCGLVLTIFIAILRCCGAIRALMAIRLKIACTCPQLPSHVQIISKFPTCLESIVQVAWMPYGNC